MTDAAMSTEEIIKRWGASKTDAPDDWESVTVEFEAWSVWYSTLTGGDDGTMVVVSRGGKVVWSDEVKWSLGALIAEILAFGQALEA